MEITDILTNIGVLVGTAVAAWIAYKTKNPDPPAPVQNAIVAGVGMEIGNKDQNERLIFQVKRIADNLDVLVDRKQAEVHDALEEILERLAERERRG